MKYFAAFLTLFVFSVLASAAQPVTADSWTLAAQDGALSLSLTLPDGAHAYEASTGPVLPDGVAAVSAPVPKQETDALTGEPDSFYVGPGVLNWVLPAEAAPDGAVTVRWQVCVGEMCYAPGSADLAVPGMARTPAATEEPPDDAPSSAAAIRPFTLVRSADGYLPADRFLGFLNGDDSKYSAFTFAGRGFLMMLLLAILGGAALNLTPCVLPLIPVNLAMIGAGKASGNGRFTRVWHGVAYGAGITVTYGLLGVVSVLMGPACQSACRTE